MSDELQFGLICLVLSALMVPVVRWLDRSIFRTPSPPHEPPLWGLGFGLVTLGFWVLASLVFSSIVFSEVGADSAAESGKAERSFSAERLLAVSACVTATLWVLVPLCLRQYGQGLRTLGVRAPLPVNVVALPILLLAMLIVMQPVALVWVSLLEWGGHSTEEQTLVRDFQGMVNEGDVIGITCMAISATLLAPLAEELMFRSVLFGGLVGRVGGVPAAVGSSLVFAAVHSSLAAFLPLTLVGVVLCYVYRKTRSIIPAMVLHGLFNAASLGMVFLRVYAIENGLLPE